jgi:tRNA(Ile)-lysidine synthase
VLARARDAFDRRIDPGLKAPIAVGFSGGGDSLALLLAVRAWATDAGRPVLALSVDHGLNPLSRGWISQAEATAKTLGVGFRALRWQGPKPQAGIQAAARRARHALLAEATRQAGATVLLLGHTRDDAWEAGWMRAQGSSVGIPREWAPSPVWPEGRDLFLLRPLLQLGRAELRELLRPCGLDWIEDPANDDGRFLRTHARRSAPAAAPNAPPAEPRGDFTADAAGAIRLDRTADPRLLAMACVATGGGERLPRRVKLDRLAARIAGGEHFTATLAGAGIEAGQALAVFRDGGRIRQGEMPLPAGQPMVWDGRFEIRSDRPGCVVRPLGGIISRLEQRSRSALNALAPQVRRTLPALVEADGTVTCPILARSAWSAARSLVSDRLEAACGRIARELAPASGSHGEQGSGALS